MTLVGSIVLGGIPQAAYADTPTYDPVFYYCHPDHLGSAQLMTDRAGEIVQHYGYHTYGGERFRDNTSAFSVSSRYTGQTLDEDTGLYYYGARYYDPEVARFIQADSTVPDPEFSQAYNRYAYVYNNPLKFTDPTGQYPYWGAAASGFTGAYMGAMQAALAGGSIVMGTYVGLVNSVANTTVIPTTNNAATVLTSGLTGNTSTPSYTTDWREPIVDDNTQWSPVTYDYSSGENPTLEGVTYAAKETAKEAGHVALDVAGSIEPTPFADLANAAWYAYEGRRAEATVSVAGAILPYAGDVAGKGLKYGAFAAGSMALGSRAGRHGNAAGALTRGARRVIDKPWKSVIEGTAHGSRAHKIRTYREAIAMAKSGNYERVFLNRSLRKATGGQIDSLMRPDVTGVLKNAGRIDMVEVVSPPRQTPESQWKKIQQMRDMLSPRAGSGRVVKPH